MRKNRNGILVFKSNEDMFDIFLQKAEDAERVYSEKRVVEKHIEQKYQLLASKNEEESISNQNHNQNHKTKKLRKDKHGMPFIDGAISLSKIFEETGEEENFSNLIENALKGKNQETMMREKADKPLPDPVPLKKRLKRYPPPEDVIDLHGYTAKEALLKTETYLRKCWRNGFFTIQIIVGRGIHSAYGAVLPDVVEELLIRLRREGVLLWFEWDKRTKKQSGSVIAYLKQF